MADRNLLIAIPVARASTEHAMLRAKFYLKVLAVMWLVILGFGDCCSPYGWCGSELGHCGDGCQSTRYTDVSRNVYIAVNMQSQIDGGIECQTVGLGSGK
jgi:hypothetical protein